MTHEREITEPVDLCRPDGRLNPAAVGWSRRPLHRANLRGWGRAKRWEHWGVVTPTHILGLVASSLDYAGVQSLYLLDRRTGRETTAEAVVPFARGTVLPPVSGDGPVRARGGNLTIAVDQGPDGSTLRASAPGVEVDLTVPLPAGARVARRGGAVEHPPLPVHGQGHRPPGARHADCRRHRVPGGGGVVRGARPRPGQVAVRGAVELGGRQRAGPVDPARREVDRRHRLDRERGLRRRAAAQDRRPT